MKFIVKDQYMENFFGGASDEDIEITQRDGMDLAEVERLARGWGMDVDELMEQLEFVDYENVVSYMDDDLREEIHMDMAPCSDWDFYVEYCKRHEAKFGEEFEIN